MFFERIERQKTFVKQFLYYFLIFLITISLIGIMIYYTAVNIIKDEAERIYVSMINGIKSNIDGRVEEVLKLSSYVGNSRLFYRLINMYPEIDYTRVSYLDFSNISSELATYKAINSFIDEVFLYLPNDNIIVTSSFKDSADYFFENTLKTSDSDQFSMDLFDTADNNILIPNIKFNYLGRNYDSIVFIQKVSPAVSSLSAWIITMTRRSSVENILNSFATGFDNRLYIIDSSNQVLATNISHFTGTEKEKIYPYSGGLNITKQIDKYFGEEYMIYHIPSDMLDWEYVAVTPISLVTYKVTTFRNIFFTTLLVSLVLSLILISYLTRRSLNPVRKIVSMINDYSLKKANGHESEFELIENCISDLRHEKEHMEWEIHKFNLIQRDNLLVKLAKGLLDKSTSMDFLRKNGIILEAKYYKATIFEIHSEEESKYDSEILTSNVILHLRERIKKDSSLDSWYIFEIGIMMVMILSASDQSDDDMIRQTVEYLKKETETDLGIVISAASGDICRGHKCVPLTCEQALLALNYRLLKGNGCHTEYSHIKDQDEYVYYYPLEKELGLIESLCSGNYEAIERIIDELVKENLLKKHAQVIISKFLFYDMQATALKAIQKINLPGYDKENLLNRLSALNTFDEMIIFLKKVYFNICCSISENIKKNSNSLITNILDHIEANFNDPNYSLSLCSNQFDLSDSYLSRFFKDKTGLNFSEYVNRKRIETAKSMLAGTSFTIKDIGRKSGFLNEVTFRRVFRKYELSTPADYRHNSSAIIAR